MGCGGERDNQVGVGISDKVYTVIGFKRFTICTIYSYGLVKGAYLEGGGVDDAKLTNMGKVYLMDNPKLRNPLDWKWVVAIVVVVVFILLIIGYALL